MISCKTVFKEIYSPSREEDLYLPLLVWPGSPVSGLVSIYPIIHPCWCAQGPLCQDLWVYNIYPPLLVCPVSPVSGPVGIAPTYLLSSLLNLLLAANSNQFGTGNVMLKALL